MSGPVVVSGAGIAGSALALGLARAGIDVVVCEAHPDDGADAGAFLTLAANGVRALDALDAADAVAAVSDEMTDLRVFDATGAEVHRSPLGGGDETVRYRCLTRAVLARTLRDLAVARGVEVRHGARVAGATPGADGVTVHLDGADDLHGCLLVGADGLHSPVRTIIDPQAEPPRPIGQRVYYGSSHGAGTGRPGDFHVFRTGVQAFAAIPTPDGRTRWFARVDDPVPDDAVPDDPVPDDADPRAALLAVLGGGTAAEIVAAAEETFVTDVHDLPHVGPWSRDRMVVIGDAAHAASPATGQGATMALEDAVVLAKALRQDPAVDAALARHERLRRGRTQANVVASAAMSGHPAEGADPGETLPDEVLHTHLDRDRPLP
ncbi:2-polyprenyl-6-methoxyphenol hydroxylase-like FAD-dependent oxidoreductase [Pseudonocardia sediminis]|uniref:2-polyprenyl-6-methoxyphenol hydroxylase-like FAD-dependent oxidoreductase n=1 Tax=Pseudonocardia sediminis TaxID=1397368 RepID=A0A4Q7UW99_PSEST|nr:NAD(P)/FAD-dependent oxidoreductase [Pseudonocardia sediminis]RZT86045.1 2-polyprenyl-6-methoxyphenol hydroxylase-like FAD-dependent oxidoreductase [Pseudonocardia sediminis]